MKKIVFAVAVSTLLISCGEDKKTEEKSEPKCKMNGVAVDCKVEEDIDKATDLVFEFVASYDDVSYEELIEKNEAILKELEAYEASIQKGYEIDPEDLQYTVDAIADAKESVAQAKQALIDIEGLVVRIDSLYDNDILEGRKMMDVTFENTSPLDVDYLELKLTYYDADGNLLAEEEDMMTTANYEPEVDDYFPAGYKGVYDRWNIRLDDEEKNAMIAKIDIEILEVNYQSKEDE